MYKRQAQYALGVRYARGHGVSQNDQEAVYWYWSAAEQGHAAAQYVLGMRYEQGRGVPKNDRKAVHWYRLAAQQGYAAAQYPFLF